MAGKSASKVVAHVEDFEDDDEPQYVIAKRRSSTESTDAGTTIANVLEDITASHPPPTIPLQPTDPIQCTDLEGSTDDVSRVLLDIKRGTHMSDLEKMHLTTKKMYDCRIYVYLYIKAIIEGRSVRHFTPEDQTIWVMQVKLASHLLIEGRMKKKTSR